MSSHERRHEPGHEPGHEPRHEAGHEAGHEPGGESVPEWVERLGDAVPSPGGGAAAAVLVAAGAALARMVAGYSTGEKAGFGPSDAVAAGMRSVAGRGQVLARRSTDLAEADAAASAAFAAAFRLPADTGGETRRRDAVEVASRAAAQSSVEVGTAALEALELLAEVAVGSNPVVLSDVAVGAACVGGALRAAAVNVEVNRAAGGHVAGHATGSRTGSAEEIGVDSEVAALDEVVAAFDAGAARADALLAAVRSRIASSGT